MESGELRPKFTFVVATAPIAIPVAVVDVVLNLGRRVKYSSTPKLELCTV